VWTSQDIIIWNTREFGFVTLDDGYSTGRASCRRRRIPTSPSSPRQGGRLIGNLSGLLATLKALPLAYNRDLQEDKEPVFDSVRRSRSCCPRSRAWWRRCDVARMAALAPAGSRWPPTWPSGS
jgi:argininosuccinate lyase